MYLLIPYRPPVIRMAGFWATAYIPETFMTAGHLRPCMTMGIKRLTADAAYKTPAIAKQLIDDGITPVFPYKRPMTKEGFFRKYEYVYDEYYDCYICPNNQLLSYSTTNRDGFRVYKSCGAVCEKCPYLSQFTESREHVKVVTRHVWEPYMEFCEDIRHTVGKKELYDLRKRNNRTDFRECKREPWIPVYANDRKSPYGNESRANICLHEFKETGKNESPERAYRGGICFG